MYKRQVPQDEKVQAFIAESKNNRNRCYELSEQVTAQAVSYTHLDVYKRQVLKRDMIRC